MPRVFSAPNPNSIVHLAVERAGGLKNLAEDLGLNPKTIGQWVKLDRIPARHLLKVCHLSDTEPLALISYIERRKKPWVFKSATRKANTLDTLVRLQNNEITEGKAFLETRMSPRVIRQTLTLWGSRLALLRDTLHSTLPDTIKAARLGISGRQLRRLKATYLPAPDRESLPYRAARKAAKARWKAYRHLATQVVRGDVTRQEAAAAAERSTRQMDRWIEKALRDQFGLLLREILPLPKSFRYALAEEIDHDHAEVIQPLIEYWRTQGMVAKAWPDPVAAWGRTPIKRCLIWLLTGEVSMQALCDERNTDKGRLIPLLTGNLVFLGVSFEQAASWSIHHQEALAMILNSM